MEGKKILIVDDEKKVRELLNQKLLDAGYEVIQAQNGEEGVKQARKHLPNLILMDVMMPCMDGAEAVHQLQENPKTGDIPVIFLTSMITKEEEKDQTIVGQLATKKHRFIAKPFDPESVLIEIQRTLIN